MLGACLTVSLVWEFFKFGCLGCSLVCLCGFLFPVCDEDGTDLAGTFQVVGTGCFLVFLNFHTVDACCEFLVVGLLGLWVHDLPVLG